MESFGLKVERLCCFSRSSGARVGKRCRVIDGAVAPKRPQHTYQPTCQCNDGNSFSTPSGDRIGPEPKRVMTISISQNRPRGLDEKRTKVLVPFLRDRAEPSFSAGCVLARHEAEVRFDVMSRAEALGIVDHADEAGSDDRTYARHRCELCDNGLGGAKLR